MLTFKRIRNSSVSGLLLLSLVGLLIAYLIVVGNLPSWARVPQAYPRYSWIYTRAQQEFLEYNSRRDVSQLAPTLNYIQPSGKIPPLSLPVQRNHVRATLDARYEEQGGVSVTVYDLDFYSKYHIVYTDPTPTTLEVTFPFPTNLETLHRVRFLVDGEEPSEAKYTTQAITWQTVLEAGQEREIVISYRADGANSFSYGLHHNQRSDVEVTAKVVDLVGSEVAKASLPASASEVTDKGEVWTWDYAGLIADRDIQLTLPSRLSFAQRVAQLQDDFGALARLSPFLVGLFLASLAGVLRLSGVPLPLEGYLLIGCGLALFYPLLTFLSGMVTLALAAALALLLVSGLLIAFLSLTAGWRRIWWRIGVLLVIFLGFFSLGLLTRWQGLLMTGGSLLLVGTFMLLYARRPATPEPEPMPILTEDVPEPEVPPLPEEEAPPEPANHHCPYCARTLDDDYSFCPGCGQDTSRVRRCADCGHQQFMPQEVESIHCVRCGAPLA